MQGFTQLTKDCNTGCTTSNQSKQQIGAVCSLQSRLAPAACLQTESSTELLASGRICQNNHCSTCLRKRLWVAFLACSPRASRMRHKKEKKNPSQADSAPEPSQADSAISAPDPSPADSAWSRVRLTRQSRLRIRVRLTGLSRLRIRVRLTGQSRLRIRVRLTGQSRLRIRVGRVVRARRAELTPPPSPSRPDSPRRLTI